MAVLGVQFVLFIIIFSIYRKLSSGFSFAKLILTKGLVCYLPPSDETLREIAGLPRKQHQNNRRRRDNSDTDANTSTFNIPRNMSLQLEPYLLKSHDVESLPYYNDFRWLIDFSVSSILIYFLTELYYFFVPNSNEFNLSLILCALVLLFSMKYLFSITAIYFRGGDESLIGERNTCIVYGCFYFLIAMIILIADENILEFGLTPAYSSFNQTAYELLQAHNATEFAYGPTSFLMFKFWLAVWCGLIGAFFTFPGYRFAKMHKDALIYANQNHIIQLLLNLSFISPFFIVLMWIKPISRNYFTLKNWSNKGPIMTDDNFESTRLILIILTVTLRIVLIRKYFQSYLNIAPQKLQLIKKEAGRITNIDLQKQIARVFQYFCVASLQYATPLLLCLFMTLLMKTLGNYSWASYLWPTTTTTIVQSNIKSSSTDINVMLKNVFNPVVFRGLTGFMVWWLCSVWFSTSAIGLLYHTYFT